MSKSRRQKRLKKERLAACPTGKAAYKDKISAQVFLAREAHKDNWWQKGKVADKRLRRTYKCPICQLWHLTSKS